MFEVMFDLETLDVKPSAVVLSVGAVVWYDYVDEAGNIIWDVKDNFYRVLDLEEQFQGKRTVSQSTLLWWEQQDSKARAEAFSSLRQPIYQVIEDFNEFINRFEVKAFWANPVTFDFPIWQDLCDNIYGVGYPWTYRQLCDVRTLVREAKYSVKNHNPIVPIEGIPHTPIYDCEWQIDLLTEVRNKLIGK